MAAAIHPPHSFPGLGQLRPRLVVVRPERIRPERIRPERTRPSAAVYQRRRAVALVLVLSLTLLGAFAVVRVVGVVASAFTAGRATSVEVTTGATGATAATGATTEAAPLAGSPVARTYVVQPGDTLWTIARQLQPEGDVRPLVDRLAERHGGAALQAGDRLDLAGLDGIDGRDGLGR